MLLLPVAAVGWNPDPVASIRPTAAQSATPADLDALLALFSGVSGFEADFTEEKRIALLVRPLESTGKVYWAAPDLLAREMRSPAKEWFVVEGGRVHVLRGKHWQTLQLAASPQVARFIQSLVWVFKGDREALLRSFEAEYTPPPRAGARWRLLLWPRGRLLHSLIDSFSLEGEESRVLMTRVLERSGDETLTRYSSHRSPRTFSAEEKAAIFHLEMGGGGELGERP